MYNSKPEPMITITVRMPRWLKERINEEAQEQRRSASDIIRLALEDQYGNKNNGGK